MEQIDVSEPTVDPDDDDAPVALRDLVVITGFSGAGKSTALATFEDEGYFCVDNLPSEMISSLVELFMHGGAKVEYAAVVSDVRAGNRSRRSRRSSTSCGQRPRLPGPVPRRR